jgi:hypothetical protein
VINPEKIKLPVWVIGVGLIHAAALALVLPMLITLPAPGSIEHKAEAVDVELVPAIASPPKIDEEVDQTAALPASPPPEPGVGEGAGQPEDQAPDAIANVDPESVPSAAPVEQAEPASETPAPASAAPKKSKVDGKAKRAKAARPAPKKPAVVRATPKPKPVYRRTSQDVAKKGLIPFKGSWSQLLGGPTPVPAKR